MMKPGRPHRDIVRRRLNAEQGTVYKNAPERIALVYPSPYAVGMSSLGFQTIYREINLSPNRVAERAFLPDNWETFRQEETSIFTYESLRPIGDFPVIAFSIAYEIELAGLVQTLQFSGIPPFWFERNNSFPFILCGGPLTFSNPLPLAPFADAVLLGEADQTIHKALDILSECSDRYNAQRVLTEQISSCFVPVIHGDQLPPRNSCIVDHLPAYSMIQTPNTELRDMFLIEAVRGCSRVCSYCVMRRSAEQNMRIVPKEKILGLIPDTSRRIGLVGAGVSDHPQIIDIIEAAISKGLEVGLSSLRPEKCNPDFTSALKRAGFRTLTTAMDGASQRLRDSVNRNLKTEHIITAAKMAQKHGFRRLKLYLMLGLPTEDDHDIEELIDLTNELSAIHPLTLSISPFVPKMNTPLHNAPFAGIKTIEYRIKKLRNSLSPQVTLRAVSARWAWVEFMLAQGGPDQGKAVKKAVDTGGRFSDWKSALEQSL